MANLSPEAVQNIASVYNKDAMKITSLETASGITAHGGITTTGGRSYFQDDEKAGRLRVGGAWGMPGIFAEDGKTLAIGGASNNVKCISNLTVTGDHNVDGTIKAKYINNAAVINSIGTIATAGELITGKGISATGGRSYFQDIEKAGRLRVGGAWGMPGIFAEDGKTLAIGGASNNVKCISNLTVTGDHNVSGNITKNGPNLILGDWANKWIIHTPNDSRRSMWIARMDGNDWNWGKSIRFDGNGICIGGTCINESHLTKLL